MFIYDDTIIALRDNSNLLKKGMPYTVNKTTAHPDGSHTVEVREIPSIMFDSRLFKKITS